MFFVVELESGSNTEPKIKQIIATVYVLTQWAYHVMKINEVITEVTTNYATLSFETFSKTISCPSLNSTIL